MDFLSPNSNKQVKTPTLLQMEAVECGAAALGIILGYYGRFIPLPELRQQCGVSRDGSKASNMVKAAHTYGLHAKGFKQSLENLQELSPPYIVFWDFNHFIVVEGIQKQKVYINDPAVGRRTITYQEFDEGYTGVVLVMEPAPEFQREDHRLNIISSLWTRLRSSLGALAYCVLAGFLLTIAGLIVPVFTQIFIDEILIQQRQLWLRPLLLAMGITVLMQGTLTTLRLHYLRRLRTKLSIGMTSQFLWHLFRLPMRFYAQRYAGEISNRTTLNNQVASALSGRLATTVIDTLMIVFYALIMVQYDWILTAILITFASINIFTLQAISRHRIDANQRLMQENGKMTGTTVATLQSIETIKASGLEFDAFSRWAGYYTKAANSQQALEITNKIISVFPPLFSGLASTLLLIVGGWRVMDGHLTIGMLIAFQGMMHNFMQPVNNLVNFGSTLQDLEANLARLDDVLRNPTDPQLDATPTEQDEFKTLSRLQGSIELRNLSFGYSRLEPPLIEDFDLTVQPGQRVALVGSSGSGKSTIAKLISGLYDHWSGDIIFDRQLRSHIPRQILTNSIAVVEQDILLFSGTVRDNLTLWDTTIPEINLIRACQDAAILDVVRALPNGLDSELTEGASNLSGGQRQRLEMARALVQNPAILILDEATSALDAETEQTIDQNLRRRGCTCIIVAHRLSTIRDCDEIIVLEKGKVVQRGTHQELWQADGIYAQLIRTEGESISVTKSPLQSQSPSALI